MHLLLMLIAKQSGIAFAATSGYEAGQQTRLPVTSCFKKEQCLLFGRRRTK
jgi:hypothetical protein